MMKKLFDSTVVRFVLVGAVNTLFGAGIMFIFYNCLHLSYWLSSASNYFFGSILSYFLNKYFTFRAYRAQRKIYRALRDKHISVLFCCILGRKAADYAASGECLGDCAGEHCNARRNGHLHRSKLLWAKTLCVQKRLKPPDNRRF